LLKCGQPTKLHLAGGSLLALYREPKMMLSLNLLDESKFPFDAIDTMLSQPLPQATACELPMKLAGAIHRVRALVSSATESKDVVLTNNQDGFSVSCVVREAGDAIERFAWDFDRPFQIKVDAEKLSEILKRTRRVNLANVLSDDPRHIRFSEDGFDHVLALRV
jgi:hypothetical protein